jgi:hypothetical protein
MHKLRDEEIALLAGQFAWRRVSEKLLGRGLSCRSTSGADRSLGWEDRYRNLSLLQAVTQERLHRMFSLGERRETGGCEPE